ncbi:hypothetical protein LUZ60_008788 [Juncus effusus]|nr:hypothetical protein LUZ60_008788 [Juncus effusus]
MAALLHLRRRILSLPLPHSSLFSHPFSTSGDHPLHPAQDRPRWLELPPFSPRLDAAAIARRISGDGRKKDDDGVGVTALKWVRRCCPQIPVSFVQKSFRLRQVKKIITSTEPTQERKLRRVSAKDALSPGDILHIPINTQNSNSEPKMVRVCNDTNEMDFVRSLVLYKDEAIIVVNKPPGLPVQGGVGIQCSLDSLAIKYLMYDNSEAPRLVHRLDRDSSGVLVMGRTQNSATLLHSIFREKTSNALLDSGSRILQRKYIALVIGVPKRTKGLISIPLAKVLTEDGKSEKITVSDADSAQHALTEYKVIQSFSNGFTWLELCPLTGRKHQLRVHCAEVLRTPIVGDYKYGFRAHKRWKPIPGSPNPDFPKPQKPGTEIPFGLSLNGEGNISERRPFLHLHCKQMNLPDVSSALKECENEGGFKDLKRIDFVAKLPLHMQISWDVLRSLD